MDLILDHNRTPHALNSLLLFHVMIINSVHCSNKTLKFKTKTI